MKYIFFFIFISFNIFAEVCNLDYKNYRLAAPVDCYKCIYDQKFPGDKVESTFGSVINYVSGADENVVALKKMKVLDHFLQGASNKARCSNYQSLVNEFKSEFNKQIADCEKGLDTFNQNKNLCFWVLDKYSRAMSNSFYSYWSFVDEKGQVQFIKGRSKEDLEPSIRSFNNWCKKVYANYKNRIVLDCQDAKSWVDEFDHLKKISESVRKSLADTAERISPEEARRKSFEESCKYFDTHAANTFTQDLYLQCVTR